jgi:hypothetical protein
MVHGEEGGFTDQALLTLHNWDMRLLGASIAHFLSLSLRFPCSLPSSDKMLLLSKLRVAVPLTVHKPSRSFSRLETQRVKSGRRRLPAQAIGPLIDWWTGLAEAVWIEIIRVGSE